MLNKDSFIEFMHMAASERESRGVYNSLHSTAQIENKKTPKLPTAFSYLIQCSSTGFRGTLGFRGTCGGIPWVVRVPRGFLVYLGK